MHIGDKLTDQILKQKARLSSAVTERSSDLIQKANDTFKRYLQDNGLSNLYHEFSAGFGKAPPETLKPPPVETAALKKARDFLSDTQAFIADRKLPVEIADIAREAAALRVALDQFDEPTAKQAAKRLHELLDPVDGFIEFTQLRDQDRDREQDRRLLLATAETKKDIAFIDHQLLTHIADKITEQLLKHRDRLVAALKGQVIDDINAVDDTFKNYVNDNGLRDTYVEFGKDYGKPPSSSTKPPPPLEAVLSPKSRFIIIGPAQDIILLYNASPSAPSVAKDILENLVFSSGTAALCFAQTTPDEDHIAFLARLLRDRGAAEVNLDPRPCDNGKVKSGVDIIAFSRGDMRKAPQEYVLGLANLIDHGAFREYRVVTTDEYASEFQNRRTLSLQYAQQVEHGQRDGYGVVIVTDAALPVCMVAPSHPEYVEALKQLVLTNRTAVSMKPLANWPTIEMKVEAVVLALQKQQCGYVTGEAKAVPGLFKSVGFPAGSK